MGSPGVLSLDYKTTATPYVHYDVAEREGFEPSLELAPH